MARNLDPNFIVGLTSKDIYPAFFAQITFRTQTEYLWTGPGNYFWNNQVWKGLSGLAKVGDFNEGLAVTADGMSVTLSGIDNVLLGETLADIRLGAPATLWFALLSKDMQLVGKPAKYFAGLVDKPTITPGTDKFEITLNLETEMIRLQQGQHQKYTSADQRRIFPDDTGFAWVERLNDIALIWR